MDYSNKVLYTCYATKSYLPLAKTCQASFNRHASGYTNFRLEEITEATPWLKEPVVSQPVLARSKPEYFLHLFKTTDVETIIYFGADMYFLGDVTYVQAMPGIALCTPHLVASLPSNAVAAAWNRGTGLLNSDFLILRRDQKVIDFLNWWSNMLDEVCSGDVKDGFFWDQGYLQHLLQFGWFEPICDPKLNVAYYNLHERDINEALAFQFTGYDPDRPTTLSRYKKINPKLYTPRLLKIMLDYHNDLVEAGWKLP